MTIEETFLKFAEQNNISYRFGFASDNTTKTATFYVTTQKDNDFKVTTFFLEDESMVIFSIDLEIRDKLITAEEINELNIQSKLCSFFIEPSKKEDTFLKLSHMLVGTDENKIDTLAQLAVIAVTTAEDGVEYFNSFD